MQAHILGKNKYTDQLSEAKRYATPRYSNTKMTRSVTEEQWVSFYLGYASR